MKAIQTEYKGYLFRSRLEARWAVFFDALRIAYEYEPEGLILNDGTFYLPDFYLPWFNCYLEVKRLGLRDTLEGDQAIRKISDGACQDEWAGIIAFGDPMDDDLWIYCQETSDSGGGYYEQPVTIGLSPYTKIPVLFTKEDWRTDRVLLATLSKDVEYIPAFTSENGKYNYWSFVTQRVLNAREKARQARFEHGAHGLALYGKPRHLRTKEEDT